MAYRVREVVVDARRGRIDRLVTVGILVLPGIHMPAGNEPEPQPEDKAAQPKTTLDEAEDARVLAVSQCRSVWRPFSLTVREGHHRRLVTYWFEFDFRLTTNPVPVTRWEQSAGLHEVDLPGTRAHISALQEARHLGLDNIMVVHPTIVGNPCAPRVGWSGEFEDTGDYRQPLQARTSNVITCRGGQLRNRWNLTIAHEVGHLMGLGHEPGGRSIMVSDERLISRSLLLPDQRKLHRSAETFSAAEGVRWSGSPRRRLQLGTARRHVRHAR